MGMLQFTDRLDEEWDMKSKLKFMSETMEELANRK